MFYVENNNNLCIIEGKENIEELKEMLSDEIIEEKSLKSNIET